MTDFYLNCLPNVPWSSETSDGTQCNILKKETIKPYDITKEEWTSKVFQQHKSLKVQIFFAQLHYINKTSYCLQGLSTTLAEYWMLKEVSKLDGYGSEIFSARWINASSCTCLVSVNPQGVTLSSSQSNHSLRLKFFSRNSL